MSGSVERGERDSLLGRLARVRPPFQAEQDHGMKRMRRRIVRVAGQRVADRHQRPRVAALLMMLRRREQVERDRILGIERQQFPQPVLGLGMPPLPEQQHRVVQDGLARRVAHLRRPRKVRISS